MTKEEILSEEEITVTLTLEDDSEIECEVVTVFEAAGKSYIALLPLEGPDQDTGNVYLYGFKEVEGGEPELIDITDDEEYEAAADAFEEYLDNLEFDELVEEEDNL